MLWNTLLVVRNVPDTPTGPADVQKVVKRFGAFKEALVLNHNMVREAFNSSFFFHVVFPDPVVVLSCNKLHRQRFTLLYLRYDDGCYCCTILSAEYCCFCIVL